MVAKITVPAGIRKALNYNEQKVKEGAAQCLYAGNYLKEAAEMNFNEKLGRLEGLIALNKRAATNTVHISLNFGPGEKLEKGPLVAIAREYMERIGFGDQPYLVYRHLDAGHPHIHIVTTNIQSDGKRISLHNIGRNQSNEARKAIEIAYNLQKAEGQGKTQVPETGPENARKLVYGRAATKRGITNVLDAVLGRYRYSSLAELNAILGLYNLVADRGRENGIIYRKRGLLYRVLDEKGNRIGVPIKASSVYSKPTLDFLEKKFRENEALKQDFKQTTKTSIDWIMRHQLRGFPAVKQALEKERISLVVRQNEAGIIYGLTYIDHRTKCVFNGSDIGKDYSAKAILEKCGVAPSVREPVRLIPNDVRRRSEHSPRHDPAQPDLSKLADAITDPVQQNTWLPYELKKQRKKKRKSS